MALATILTAVGAAAFWWFNRPPGDYVLRHDGLFLHCVDDRCGFVDREGKNAIALQFDEALEFSEGRAPVRIGSKWGYVDASGKIVVTPQFEGASWFRYGRASVGVGGKRGYIAEDGKLVAPASFESAGFFSGDLAPVELTRGKCAYVDRNAKVVFSGFESCQEFSGPLAAASTAGRWGFLDRQGKWVIEPAFDFAMTHREGLAVVVVGGRWGAIDERGTFVVNPQYEALSSFSEGLAAVLVDGKYGFIDTEGRVAVTPSYAMVRDFRDGLAAVKTDDGWGYIDKTGAMTIPAEFDGADNFEGGLALVFLTGTPGDRGDAGYIDKIGHLVVNPYPGLTPAQIRQQAAAALDASRGRVTGTWQGPDRRLRLTWSGGALTGHLDLGPWQEELKGRWQDKDPDDLVLNGVSVTRNDGFSNSGWQFSTFALHLDEGAASLSGTLQIGNGAKYNVRFVRATPTQVPVDTGEPQRIVPQQGAEVGTPAPEAAGDIVVRAEAHLRQARSLFDAGDLQGAQRACEQALRIDPANSEAGALRERIRKTLEILGR